MTIYKSRRKVSEWTHPADTLILDFQPPQLRDSKCLLFKHLVCDTLLCGPSRLICHPCAINTLVTFWIRIWGASLRLPHQSPALAITCRKCSETFINGPKWPKDEEPHEKKIALREFIAWVSWNGNRCYNNGLWVKPFSYENSLNAHTMPSNELPLFSHPMG